METRSELRKLVKLFTTFKTHLTIFLAINGILWLVWLMNNDSDFYSWPVYISLAWLVILVAHYAFAWKKFNK